MSLSIFGKDKKEEEPVAQKTSTVPTQEIRVQKNSLFMEWGYNVQYLSSPSDVGEEELKYLQRILTQNLDQLFPKNSDYKSTDAPDVKRSKNCAIVLRTANYSKTLYICLEKPQIKKTPDTRPKKIAKPDYNSWAQKFAENWAMFDKAKADEWLASPRAVAAKYKETHNNQEPFDTITENFERQHLIVEGVFFFNVAEDLRSKFTNSGFVNEWPISLEIEIQAGQTLQTALGEAVMRICKLISEKSSDIKKLSEYAGAAIIENSDATSLLAKELGAKRGLEEVAKVLSAVHQAVLSAAGDLEGKTQEHAAKRIAATSNEIAKQIMR